MSEPEGFRGARRRAGSTAMSEPEGFRAPAGEREAQT